MLIRSKRSRRVQLAKRKRLNCLETLEPRVVLATIGDLVWNDVNANGIRDTGELGIPDVDVNLLSSNGTLLESTQTGPDGTYSFDSSVAPIIAPTEGLVAYLSFDEGTGTSAADSSTGGTDHAAELRADATWSIEGKSGAAVSLDGTGDFVAIPDSPDVNTVTQRLLSVSVWFNADDVSVSSRKQVIYEQGGNVRGLTIYLHDGLLYVGAFNDANTGWPGGTFLTTNPGDVSSGTWHHVALVLNGSSGPTLTADSLKGYLDGNEFGSGQATQSTSHPGDIGIGRVAGTTKFHDGDSATNADGFEGLLDEFRIYHRALDASQVRTLAGTKMIKVELAASNFSSGGVLEGYTISPRDVLGVDEALDSDIDDPGVTFTLEVSDAVDNLDIDAGLFAPSIPVSTLGDLVWDDVNGNGIQDGGEPGISDVVVNLLDANGNVLQSELTGPQGEYEFTVDGRKSFVPVDDGLVTYLSLDGASGTTAIDTSPFGLDNTGTLVGGADLVPSGQLGSAEFDGTNDSIDIATTPDMNASTRDSLSVSLWFRPHFIFRSDKKQVLFEQGGSNRGINIYIHDGLLYVGSWNDSSPGFPGTFLATAPGDIQNGVWHHVSLVLSGDHNLITRPDALRGYLDGVEFGSGESTRWVNQPGDIGIGIVDGATRFHDGPSDVDAYRGYIDEFRFYTRALDSNEVKTLAHQQHMVSVQVDASNFETGAPLEGRVFSALATSTDAMIDSDVDPGTGQTHLITLPVGTGNSDVDAGLFPISLGNVSGNIFEDANANAIADDGGSPIANWKVEVTVPEKQAIVSTNQVFTNPQSVIVTATGELMVADPHRGVLVRINPNTGRQRVFADLDRPFDLALKSDGTFYAVDGGSGELVDVDRFGRSTTIYAALSQPRGVAIESSGDVLVTNKDTRELLRIDPVTRTAQVVVGDLAFPEHLTIDAAGFIYVVERQINQVSKIDPVSGAKTVVTKDGHLVDPWGIELDPSGDLVVVSRGNAMVVAVDIQTGEQSIMAENDKFIDPHSVAFDSTGQLWVSDVTAPIGGGSIMLVEPREFIVSAKSSPTGEFSFPSVPPGEYALDVTPADDWTVTTIDPLPIVVPASGSLAGLEVGAFELIDVHGTKFVDANENGVLDDGEVGQSDWYVFLDENRNGVWNIDEPNATTDADGNYTLADIGPGSHSILTRQQIGWMQSHAEIELTVDTSGVDVEDVDIGSIAETESQHSNVLMISIDDLNDWLAPLGGYGGVVHSPNLTNLLARGALFDEAHVPGVQCDPTRSAVMTGLTPHNVDILGNGPHWRYTAPDAVSMPAYFRQHGFTTVGISKSFHQTNPIDGDPTAWDVSMTSGTAYLPDANDSISSYHPFLDFGPADATDGEFRDAVTADSAIAQLQNTFDNPFYMAVGFLKPHAKWIVPQEYFDLYPLESIVLPTVLTDDLDDIPQYARDEVIDPFGHTSAVENNIQAEVIQAYLASLSFMDAQLGRMMEAFDESPYADNTVIALWSDHGYHFGEKEHWAKYTLWNESTRVPFGIVAPGVTQSNQIVGDVTNVLDLYPTLTDLAGLPTPEFVDGETLRPLLDQSVTDDGRPAVTSSLDGDTVRTNNWRYIRYIDGSEELYDEVADPNEWNNLAGDPAYDAVIAQLQTFLPGAENETFRVVNVQVASSDWEQAFIDSVDPETQFGYTIPKGSAQLATLPWGGIDQVRMQFNHDVGTATAGDFQISGLNVGSYTIDSFSVDGRAVTLNLDEPISIDRLQLSVGAAVARTGGETLDGEWLDGQTGMSGDGNSGGAFNFAFNVLPGDINQSGAVAVSDIGSLRANLGANTFTSGYSIFADLNGSGGIAVSDVSTLRTNLGMALPATPMPVAARAAVSRSERSLAVDAVVSELRESRNDASLYEIASSIASSQLSSRLVNADDDSIAKRKRTNAFLA